MSQEPTSLNELALEMSQAGQREPSDADVTLALKSVGIDPNDEGVREQLRYLVARSAKAAPSLGEFYDRAEVELGPSAPHFDVVKRALFLWEHDDKIQEPKSPRPGADAQ